MISRLKVEVLRSHILNERASPTKTYAYRPKSHVFARVLEELEESGLVEVERVDEVVRATRITPSGILCYLRAVGRAVGKKSGRDYFSEFVRRNPEVLDRCGPIQRERVEKYLVLGFMPPSPGKGRPSGTQGEENQT